MFPHPGYHSSKEGSPVVEPPVVGFFREMITAFGVQEFSFGARMIVDFPIITFDLQVQVRTQLEDVSFAGIFLEQLCAVPSSTEEVNTL